VIEGTVWKHIDKYEHTLTAEAGHRL